MFVQGLELSDIRQICTVTTFLRGLGKYALWKNCKVTLLYRDRNCLQYGKIANMHIFAGIGTVCITVTLQIYLFLHGKDLSAVG